MKNRTIYASIMVILSVLLVSSLTISAEAEPNSNSAIKTDGSSAYFTFGDGTIGGLVIISTMSDSSDLIITYQYQDKSVSDNLSFGFNCAGSSEFLEISKKMDEGKIEFDTGDLTSCLLKIGDDGLISLTLQGDESKPDKGKFSYRTCNIVDGEEVCTKTHGTQSSVTATAEGTLYGTNMSLDGNMGTEKAIITHSNKGE